MAKDRVCKDIGPEGLEDWDAINWPTVKQQVRQLRQRIYRATQKQQWNQVRSLTKLLLHSFSNLLLSVRKVTAENQGRRTPGIDRKLALSPKARLKLVIEMQEYESWKVKPARRIYIPKADGKQRPLGILTIKNRVAQAIVKNALEPYCEAQFESHSYGFRPGRSCHDAIEQCWRRLNRHAKDRWALDADIKSAFTSINREWLVKFVEHRIADKRVVRLIQKWLKAGVFEDGKVDQTEDGVPQGASASPLLANVYLHYVYDLWVQWWRQKRAQGEVIVVRFADDTIVGFQYKSDAERFLAELKERLLKFGLELHPEKTRLLMFGRFAAQRKAERKEGKPESFQFLGFTHSCGESKDGKFTVVRQTIKKRLRAKVKEIKQEIEHRMHAPIKETGKWLAKVLVGHYQYYGVSGNFRAMDQFRYRVYCAWRHALLRRSQKARMTWEKMNKIIDYWLPRPRLYQELPIMRFMRSHPR